jgi:hypothetical protein
MSTTQRGILSATVIPDNIPEVEYPPEEIERLNRLRDVMEVRLATGELELMTIEEYENRRQLSGRYI